MSTGTPRAEDVAVAAQAHSNRVRLARATYRKQKYAQPVAEEVWRAILLWCRGRLVGHNKKKDGLTHISSSPPVDRLIGEMFELLYLSYDILQAHVKL